MRDGKWTSRTRRAITLLITIGVATGLAPAARAGAPALTDHLDMDYVREVTEELGTIGSTPLGFRVLGTPQDRQTATYLADQMEEIGLEGVGVETFRGDAWHFEGASVRATGPGLDRTFPASSLGGVPGTGSAPVSGEIVPVGYGTAPEYRRVDVDGKIALAWWDYDRKGIWPNYIAYEAKAHGADAVIIASAPGHAWYSAGGGRALGSNDAECSLDACAPMVVISRRSATTLLGASGQGQVRGTVELRATNELGATAYQPIGQITGSRYPDRAIVFTAHQDAWFTSAADDSVGVAMSLAVAKAVIDSGYRPQYTWIFAPVTGEEYGLANAYYDWLQGAFHRITDAHTEWQTDAMAVLNWEVHSPPYRLGVESARELRALVGDSLRRSQDDGLIDGFGLFEVFAWNDGFTYTAEGAPAVTFAASGPDYLTRYHTDYDSLDTLDFPSLEPVLAAQTRIALDLDATQLPYDFRSRIKHLGRRVDPAVMRAYGADAVAVEDAMARLRAAWRDAKDVAPGVCASRHLREATRLATDELTALSFADDTIYPHALPEWDLQQLDGALGALANGHPRSAARMVADIDLNGLAAILSRSSFRVEQRHHDPDYERISWGAQGQLTQPIDLYGTWHTLASARPGDDLDGQIRRLRRVRRATVPVYRERVDDLGGYIDRIAQELRATADC